MPDVDRKRLEAFFTEAPRFKPWLECSPESGVHALQDVFAVMARLEPFFRAAETGDYPLAPYNAIHITEFSYALAPFFYGRHSHHVVQLSAPTVRPRWMPEEVYQAQVIDRMPAQLVASCEQTFADYLHETDAPRISARLPDTLTYEDVQRELWYAFGMAFNASVRTFGGNTWRFLETPLVHYVAVAATRDDALLRQYDALLDALRRYLPIGRMRGTTQLDGVHIAACR